MIMKTLLAGRMATSLVGFYFFYPVADLVLGKLSSIEKVVDAGGLDGLSGALEGLEDKETMLDDMMSRLDLGEDDE